MNYTKLRSCGCGLLKSFTSKGFRENAPQLKRIQGICDCVGQKMVATFKTEKEANEKMLDATAIANECKEEWQKMEIQHLGK